MDIHRMKITGEELLKRFIAGERNFNRVFVKKSRNELLFQGVDLSGINLERATLSVDFSGATMRDSNFRYSVWGDHLSWEDIDFTGSDFTGINNAVGCVFTRCDFSETIWSEADLWQSTFKDCTTWSANFYEARFSEVHFEK